jgi:hypothetical protein
VTEAPAKFEISGQGLREVKTTIGTPLRACHPVRDFRLVLVLSVAALAGTALWTEWSDKVSQNRTDLTDRWNRKWFNAMGMRNMPGTGLEPALIAQPDPKSIHLMFLSCSNVFRVYPFKSLLA